MRLAHRPVRVGGQPQLHQVAEIRIGALVKVAPLDLGRLHDLVVARVGRVPRPKEVRRELGPVRALLRRRGDEGGRRRHRGAGRGHCEVLHPVVDALLGGVVLDPLARAEGLVLVHDHAEDRVALGLVSRPNGALGVDEVGARVLRRGLGLEALVCEGVREQLCRARELRFRVVRRRRRRRSLSFGRRIWRHLCVDGPLQRPPLCEEGASPQWHHGSCESG